MKLFAVYLGGRAPKCNTELHDVVFVCGERIEDTYVELMEKWFGTPIGLHLDSWMELSVVDGYRISLKREKSVSTKKLFFINLGAYLPGQFTEAHANAFLVADSEPEVKRRAKERLLCGYQTVHTDDLYDVDDCLELAQVSGYSIHLEKTDEAEVFRPQNGYHLIPKDVVQAFLESR